MVQFVSRWKSRFRKQQIRDTSFKIKTNTEKPTKDAATTVVVSPTNDEIKQIIIDVLKSHGSQGTTMTSLVEEVIKLSSSDMQVVFKLYRELRSQGKIKEENAKLIAV